MKTRRRPYYRTKAEWANAQVTRLQQEYARACERHVPSSNWGGVRSKMTGLGAIQRDVTRYQALAERFAASGE